VASAEVVLKCRRSRGRHVCILCRGITTRIDTAACHDLQPPDQSGQRSPCWFFLQGRVIHQLRCDHMGYDSAEMRAPAIRVDTDSAR